VEKSEELTSAERERIASLVTTEAPSPEHELDISFENKVKLIGYDVSVERATAGEGFDVTWYWKVERPLEEGWRLFTHVADASGESRLNQDMEGDIRQLYQPGRWKTGEYIADKQHVTVPADWTSPRVTFFLGLWNGPHRLQVTSGPSDGDNRARVLTLDVVNAQGTSPAAPARQSADARRTTAAIAVDGKLDEPAWAEAAATPRFVNTMTGGSAEPEATAKVLWDDTSLYVAFEVKDVLLKSSFENRDDHLWEQDCVEVMIDPAGDGRNYFELQVAPTGKTFETRYDTRRQPQPFGHVDWNPEIRAAVERRGTANDEAADEGYTVELAIPWAALVGPEGEPGVKPEANTAWRVNFFVMDAQAEGQRAVGWAPPRVGDFHALDRFGDLRFVDPAAPPPAGETARAAPTPGATPTPAKVTLRPEVLRQLQVGNRGGLETLRGADGPARPGPGETAPTGPAPAGMR
jgi:hypothetical protein